LDGQVLNQRVFKERTEMKTTLVLLTAVIALMLLTAVLKEEQELITPVPELYPCTSRNESTNYSLYRCEAN
jgi:hypothetical protein